jgi:hypothetical protein
VSRKPAMLATMVMTRMRENFFKVITPPRDWSPRIR